MALSQVLDRDSYDETGFSEAFREVKRSLGDNHRFLVDHFIKGDGGGDKPPGLLTKAFNTMVRFPIASVFFGATEAVGGMYRGFNNHIRRIESEKDKPEHQKRWSEDNKPVVLSIGSDPENMKVFLGDIEASGYDIQHFSVSDTKGLMQTAYNAAAEGRPVAMIGTDLMSGQKDSKGGKDINELSRDLKEATKGSSSLTINYSSQANPHDHDWDEGADKVKNIQREEWNSAYGAPRGTVANVVLDRFFKENGLTPNS